MLRRRYNPRFADEQSAIEDSDTDPSDYEGLTESDFQTVARGTRTINPKNQTQNYQFEH